jgi:mannosyl-oligosaccharide glucosidase
MLMSNWDPYLTMEVLSSWMGCMLRVGAEGQDRGGQEEGGQCRGGWIPRELILGQEAFKVVPSEFVTQRVDIANPPTLLIAVEKLVEKLHKSQQSSAEGCQDDGESTGGDSYCAASQEETIKFQTDLLMFLKDYFFSLHDWVQWFIDSQGVEAGDSSAPADSFRWRGRPTDSSRLAPNTLASGLDDYPRSQFPSNDEHHVDLLSWVASSCRVLQRVSAALVGAKEQFGVDLSSGFVAEVEKVRAEFYSEAIVSRYIDNLVTLHWSSKDQTFYDVGLVGSGERIDVGVMVRCTESKQGGQHKDVLVEMSLMQQSRGREPSVCPTAFPQYMYPLGDGKGGLQTGNMYRSSKSLSVGFIPRVGYVNMFPLLLKLLPSDSPQLGPLLALLSSPSEGLWSQHGLRSLSKKDLFYQKENAPGDAPYWR